MDTGKDRFIETDQTAEVISTPQCIDCKHNMGMLECAALASKPMQYVTNVESCPMYEKAE